MNRRRSRLARKEEAKNLRQAWFFGALTILAILVIIFLGIPALIKLAAFLGEIKDTTRLVEKGDQIAPPPPQLYALPQAVNQPEIKLEGNTEPDAKITVFLNGHAVKETVSDKNGAFSLQVNLTGERNELSVWAEDQAGNQSQESEKMVIFLDEKPPLIEISSPPGGQATSEESHFEITGKTEPEASLLINGRLVIVNQEGNFSYLLPLNEGENVAQIVAQDQAGNQTETEVKINYQPF